VLIEVEDVGRYADLFGRLRQAAMPPEESVELLIEIARGLAVRD